MWMMVALRGGERQRSVVTEPARQPTNITTSAPSITSRVDGAPPLEPTTPRALRVRLRDRALTGHRGRDRAVEELGDPLKLVERAGDDRPAAADDDGAPGVREERRGFLDRLGLGAGTLGGEVGVALVGEDLFGIDRALLRVERKGEVDGARACRWSWRGRRCASSPAGGPNCRARRSTWSAGGTGPPGRARSADTCLREVVATSVVMARIGIELSLASTTPGRM